MAFMKVPFCPNIFCIFYFTSTQSSMIKLFLKSFWLSVFLILLAYMGVVSSFYFLSKVVHIWLQPLTCPSQSQSVDWFQVNGFWLMLVVSGTTGTIDCLLVQL